MKSPLTLWLEKQGNWLLTFFISMSAFATYFCIYSLRKPFTAAIFEGYTLWSIDYKIVLVIAHVFGYATAKGLGIQFISSLKPENRASVILKCVLFSLASLFFFAIVPPPYNFVFMYFNGLPVGFCYGLVLSYLEGRKITEILGAFLTISFITAAGFVKSVGRWLIQTWHSSDFWMPFWAGAIFLPFILLFLWLLNQSPAPTSEDEKSRTARVPMTKADRRHFFQLIAPGAISLILMYLMITILRDIRENFAVEIFKELKITDLSVFTYTELVIGLSIILLTGLLFIVQNNRKAFWLNLTFIGAGFLLIIGSTWGLEHGYCSPIVWMTLLGLGIYLGYVPYNCTLFERMIAVMKERSNINFMLYLADFIAYLGSVGVMLYKNFGNKGISWLKFYTQLAYIFPVISIGLMVFTFWYFKKVFNVKL